MTDHKRSSHPRNINKSKLHLNKSGTLILSSNFAEAISNILDCHEIDEYNSISENALLNNELISLCIRHANKLIFAQLNSNSLRNKLEFFFEFVRAKLDILMILEIKIDESFPLTQFNINGFKTPFHYDHNSSGGVLCFLFRRIYRQNLQ